MLFLLTDSRQRHTCCKSLATRPGAANVNTEKTHGCVTTGCCYNLALHALNRCLTSCFQKWAWVMQFQQGLEMFILKYLNFTVALWPTCISYSSVMWKHQEPTPTAGWDTTTQRSRHPGGVRIMTWRWSAVKTATATAVVSHHTMKNRTDLLQNRHKRRES